MKKCLIFICLIFLSDIITLIASSPVNPNKFPTYEEFYKAVKNIKLDPKKIVNVKDLSINRDVGNFTFEEGTFYFAEPIARRMSFCVFMGKGKFFFAPQTKNEQKALERQTKVKFLNEEFSSLILFFADDTYNDIIQDFKPHEEDMPRMPAKIINDIEGYYSNADNKSVLFQLSKALLSGNQNDFFFAGINLKNFTLPLFYMYNPFSNYEVNLYKGDWRSGINKYIYSICSFHDSFTMDIPGYDYDEEERDSMYIDNYIINCSIDNHLKSNFKAQCSLKEINQTLSWVNFTLSRDFIIDSIVFETGDKLPFFKEKESYDVLVCLSDDIIKRKEGIINFYYHGQFRRNYNYVYIYDYYYWYPDCDRKFKRHFDMTFRYPDNYTLIANGDSVSYILSDDYKTQRWITNEPVEYSSFNIGPYNVTNIKDTGLPPMTFYDIYFTGHKIERDVKQSYKLFTQLFGSLNLSGLKIIDSPTWVDNFPGFIQLNFVNSAGNGYIEQDRASIIANQWWTLNMKSKGLRDRWINSSLCDYSGLIYVQNAIDDKDLFHQMLNNTKDYYIKQLYEKDIIEKPCPLTNGYYYSRGVWVMHMLRNLCLDLKTGSEQQFFNILSDFYKTFKGKKITTTDFRKTFEKYLNTDMTWFFDEWTENTYVPRYKFSYKVNPPENGSYKITVHFSQEKVPDNFAMYMIIKVTGEDDKYGMVRVLLTGKQSTFDLPMIPFKPKEVIFNANESVLCEYDTEKWKD